MAEHRQSDYQILVAVADAVDAMLSDRPYRQALDLATVIVRVRQDAGAQFDPQVVEAFLRIPQRLWLEVRAKLPDQRPDTDALRSAA